MQAKRRRSIGLALALVLMAVAALLGACGRDSASDLDAAGSQPTGTTAARRAGAVATATAPSRDPTPTPTTTPRNRQTGEGQAAGDGLPTIAAAQLPPEARETIRLIERGGPFPFDKDGATFGNRERHLPARPSGYYREYTVITPGSPDRGARRIVAGESGELYYTDDHYESFKRVIR